MRPQDAWRVTGPVPAAVQAIGLCWRTAREELTEAGAHCETLDAIAGVLADVTPAAPGHAIFARDGMVIGTHELRAAPATPIARLAPLPLLLPALANDLPAMPPCGSRSAWVAADSHLLRT